jgi:hypothetical protein
MVVVAGMIGVKGAHRYSGHGSPGVQTGFTHRSFTAMAMTEVSMRAEKLLAKFCQTFGRDNDREGRRI